MQFWILFFSFLVLLIMNMIVQWFNRYEFNQDIASIKIRREEALIAFEQMNTLVQNENEYKRYSFFFNQTGYKKVCLGIISVSRTFNNSYLTQSVMSLLTRTNLSMQHTLSITIFNVDENEHYEANNLSKIVQVVIPTFPAINVGKLDVKRKQIADFIATMIYFIKHKNCENYIILEDDALASQNWLDQVLKLHDEIPERVQHNWFTIKLYWDFHYLGWNNTDTPLMLVLSFIISFFYIFLIYIIFQFISFLYSSNNSNQYINQILKNWMQINIFQFICLIVLSILLLKSVGKSNIMFHVKQGLNEFTIGYGNVGVLYNGIYMKNYVDFIEDYLFKIMDKRGKDILAVDLLPYEFMSKYNLTELIVFPTIFQHIGISSNFDHYDKIYLSSDNFPDDETPILFDKNLFFNVYNNNRK